MLFRKRRAARKAFKADPLEMGERAEIDAMLAEIDARAGTLEVEVDPWIEQLAPQPDDDPDGADLATPDPIPAGAVRSGQDVYADGRRCSVCTVAALTDPCVKCTLDGHTALPPALPEFPIEADDLDPPPWVTVAPAVLGACSAMNDEQLMKLLALIFTCEHEGCGARIGHDGLCEVGGINHASPEHIEALATWGDPE